MASKEGNVRHRRKPRNEGQHQQQQQQQNQCAPSWSWRDPEIWIFISMLVIIMISLSYLFYVGGFKEETINGDGSEAVGGEEKRALPDEADELMGRDSDDDKVRWKFQNSPKREPGFLSYGSKRAAEIEKQYLLNENFYSFSLGDVGYDIYLDPVSKKQNFFLQINKKTQNVRKVQRCVVGSNCFFSRDETPGKVFGHRWTKYRDGRGLYGPYIAGTDPRVSWDVRLRDGWTPYEPATSAEIERGFGLFLVYGGGEQKTYHAGNIGFEINFANMQQITGRSRDVRRQILYYGETTKKTVYAYHFADLKDFDQTSFNKMPLHDALVQLRQPKFNGNVKPHAGLLPKSGIFEGWQMSIESVIRCNDVDPDLKQRWNANVANYGPGAKPPGQLINLWHGTGSAAAQSIATGGFKMDKAMYGGQQMGNGNYFGPFDLAVTYSFRKKEENPIGTAYSYVLLSKIVLPPNEEQGQYGQNVGADEHFKTHDGDGNLIIIVDDNKPLPVFKFELKWTKR